MIKATAIYIGAVAEDSSGYPDCRPEFYDAFQNVIDLGTKPETQHHDQNSGDRNAKVGDCSKRCRTGRASAPDVVVLQGVGIGLRKL